MNNEEAKFTLGAYRPGGQDARDPALADALAQAKQDPKLGTWFATAQAHDAVIAAKLREIRPPADLRAAILAGARAGTMQRAWWRQPVWLAAAAAVAVLLSVAGWRLTPVRGEMMEDFAVNYVDKGFRLQKRSGDLAVLQAWLGEHRGPLPTELPAKFAELSALGCRKLDFRGKDVSLVCFERDGTVFHVFVARRDEAPGGAPDATPRFMARKNLVAATWADAKNRYVIVSGGKMADLKGLL